MYSQKRRIYFNYIARERAHRRRMAAIALGALCVGALALCGLIFGDKLSVERPTAAPEEQAAEAVSDEAPERLPPKVRGIYVTAWNASQEDRLKYFINICDTTEINALVIDIKDERGQLTFGAGTDESPALIPDIEKTMALLKSHGIYTIARLVCFKDNTWGEENPQLAIHNKRGAAWKDNNGIIWLDPYNTGAWDHIVSIAQDAARVGFDEIQLDYVRFPSDGRLNEIDYGSVSTEKTKAEAIAEFLAYIKNALAEDKVKLSADIFGITIINKGDRENIGQDMELIARNADYICPMVYPSHFANKKQNGKGQIINGTLFEAPDLKPYEVVYNSLALMKARLPESGEHAGVRPYLQDFTAAYLGKDYYQHYGAEQVTAQIKAVYDAGFDEWILWNASNEYSVDAFRQKRGSLL